MWTTAEGEEEDGSNLLGSLGINLLGSKFAGQQPAGLCCVCKVRTEREGARWTG